MPTIRAIVRDASRDHYRFSSIVLGIVKSPAFQMRKNADAESSVKAETGDVKAGEVKTTASK
jgi:hypothetical protein